MEGLFETSEGAPLVIIGNPDTTDRELESTLEMPKFLSFLTSQNWTERVTGLNDIPEDQWPDSVPLVYYAYHIMVGLGTILLVIAGIGVLLLWRRRLYTSRPMLWALMLAFPLTYIANIAGWTTAETGRQPWLVYGLLRTEDGASPAESVPAGTTIFTILGFAGLYVFMSLLFIVLILRIVNSGPDDGETEPEPAGTQPEPAGAA
jgi:cytochrome d ubiquinol oxidase subunit I